MDFFEVYDPAYTKFCEERNASSSPDRFVKLFPDGSYEIVETGDPLTISDEFILLPICNGIDAEKRMDSLFNGYIESLNSIQ